MNNREVQVFNKYSKEGWEIYHRGFPDFIMFKDGMVKFVEVKRKQKRPTKKMGLSRYQRRVIEILNTISSCIVEYID